MATRIQVRRGTNAQWNTSDPVLDVGEFGFNTTNNQLKIGTGTTSWSNLDYLVTDSGLDNSLGDYIELTDKGAANGVAELDASSNVLTTTAVVFEGSSADDYETILQVTNPTDDRTITIPDSTGTVALTTDLSSFATTSYVTNSVSSHNATTTNVHGITDTAALATTSFVGNSVSSHAATTATHGVSGAIVGTTDAQTLSSKTIALGSNTVSGSISEFNTALTDADFATLSGTETFANKTLTSPTITGTGAIAGTFTGNITGNLTGNADSVTNGVYTNAANTITAATASTKPLILKGAESQSANLLEIQNSSGTALTYWNSTGGMTATEGVISTVYSGGKLTTGTLGYLNATTFNAAVSPIVVRGAASQTANLQEWQNSSGTVLASISASGNLSVQDLTVNGTTTTINSTTLTVDDKNIELASIASPTDVTADGAGITVKGTTDKTFNWVDATDAWTASEHMNLVSGKSYKINNTAISAALPALTWGDVKSGKSGLTIG